MSGNVQNHERRPFVAHLSQNASHGARRTVFDGWVGYLHVPQAEKCAVFPYAQFFHIMRAGYEKVLSAVMEETQCRQSFWKEPVVRSCSS